MGKTIAEHIYSRKSELLGALLGLISIFVSIVFGANGFWFWFALPLLCLSLIALAALGLFWVCWPRLQGRITLREDYEVGPAEPRDFAGIVGIGRALITPDIDDPEHLFKYYNRNKNTIIVVRHNRYYRNGTIISNLMGYYMFIPVSEATYRVWFSGRTNGLDLRDDEILKDEHRAYAIGLLSIAAQTRRAGGYLIQHLALRTQQLGGRVKVMFARPITQDGLRFARQYGFQEHPDTLARKPGPLHVLDLDQQPSGKGLKRTVHAPRGALS